MRLHMTIIRVIHQGIPFQSSSDWFPNLGAGRYLYTASKPFSRSSSSASLSFAFLMASIAWRAISLRIGAYCRIESVSKPGKQGHPWNVPSSGCSARISSMTRMFSILELVCNRSRLVFRWMKVCQPSKKWGLDFLVSVYGGLSSSAKPIWSHSRCRDLPSFSHPRSNASRASGWADAIWSRKFSYLWRMS